MKAKKWNGSKPVRCDLCRGELKLKDQFFFDFKTSSGLWALGCPTCFVKHGGKLGLGCGQKYSLKNLVKVEG